MKEETLETVYENDDQDKETATRRIRVVPDYDYDIKPFLGAGTAKLHYATWRDEQRFISKLSNMDEDYTKEILDTNGIIFDGTKYWIQGPSDRDGQYYFSFESRKNAKEYGQFAYQEMKIFLDAGAVGFIYEEKCPCCDQWKFKDSLWGIVGYDTHYALEYLKDHPITNGGN